MGTPGDALFLVSDWSPQHTPMERRHQGLPHMPCTHNHPHMCASAPRMHAMCGCTSLLECLHLGYCVCFVPVHHCMSSTPPTSCMANAFLPHSIMGETTSLHEGQWSTTHVGMPLHPHPQQPTHMQEQYSMHETHLVMHTFLSTVVIFLCSCVMLIIIGWFSQAKQRVRACEL